MATGALRVHHVVKRAQRGPDFDLDRLVALCPPCHAQTEAPYARGRLVITPLGDGCFTVEVIRGGAFHSPRRHARVRRPTQGRDRAGGLWPRRRISHRRANVQRVSGV